MHGIWRERRYTNGYVLARLRGGVADPFPFACHNRLAGFDDRFAAFMLDVHRSGKHQGELVKIRALSGFGPSSGGVHAGDTDLRFFVVHRHLTLQVCGGHGPANQLW